MANVRIDDILKDTLRNAGFKPRMTREELRQLIVAETAKGYKSSLSNPKMLRKPAGHDEVNP
jgi:hypothetical protein